MLSDVAVTPITETIRRISAERRSGDLQVRSGRMAKTLFFDHGRLVFAASNLKKDRLGEALIELGRISEEDFRRVSALMRGETRRRFGEALVQAGVMDRYEVGNAVARQVRRVALSMFELADGAAIFEERPCTIPLDFMVSLSVHRLFYDGIRLMKDRDLVLRGLGNLDRRVVLAEVPPVPFEPKGRSSEELDILDLAGRRVTIRRLAWAEGGLAFPRLRTAYALLAAGILRDAEAPATAPEPVVQPETGRFLLSALQHRPDPSLREAVKRELQQELERSATLDRGSWLRLARSAPKTELIRALEEKMERYHALRDTLSEDDALRTDIDVVLGRASAALRVARHAPASPASGETRLARQAAEQAAAALKEAPPELVPIDGAPILIPESDTNPSLTAVKAPPPARPRRPDESIPPAGPGSSDFAGSAQIEHLLMEGEVRMTVADHANAVRVYEKLVQLAPRIPAFRVRLAIAMACWPRTAKLAEREFNEAVRLDPDNADIHYQFGLYYKAMRIRSRAVAEMRVAVRLNPRHKTAREELEVLSPKDSALTSLKKLFR
jgi:tetratricopeptide (TPR) repeat protein